MLQFKKDPLNLQDTAELESLTQGADHCSLIDLRLEHILPVTPYLNH